MSSSPGSTTTTTAECFPNIFGRERSLWSDYVSGGGLNQQKFTCTAWQAIVSSRDVAKDSKHQIVETEHLMKALLKQKNGLACMIFSKVGLERACLLDATDKYIQSQPKVLREFAGSMIGRDLKALIKRARDYKKKYRQSVVSVVHLVLGFVQDQRFGKQSLKDFQVSLQNLKSTIERCPSLIGRDPGGKYEALEKYGKDLTATAKAGMLDPVIGRDDEIRNCMRILSMNYKSNVVLVGEPNAGKTSISEGLAQRIAQGDVPLALMNCKLISLDMGALIAGAKCSGDFRGRLKDMLKKVIDSKGQIILFIDAHTIDDAGAMSGGMDVASLLMLMFGWGELRCIVAMTPKEYHKYIEQKRAFQRHFQQVYVDPPTVEDTVSILQVLRERYESHLGVRISDSALVKAAILSHHNISGQFFPDKAIGLVDGAVAKLQMEMTSKPTAIDEVSRSVSKLEKEILSLTNITDKVSRVKLSHLEVELAFLKEKKAHLNEQLEYEKSVIARVQSIKEEINRDNLELQRAKREYGFNHAAELKCGSLDFLQRQLAIAEKELAEYTRSGKSMLREVTGNDIVEIVSERTGIPIFKLQQSEREKLLNLEEELHRRVACQETAVRSIAAPIRRSWVGLSDPGRPIASFLLVDPAGVGKIELARALAYCLFDTEEAFVQVDMSKYMEKIAVSRLIGASHEEGQLIELVRKRPYVVILFDEIEKAHIDVLDVLIQILDKGKVTDSNGRTVTFTNAIIIITSNVGSEYILNTNDDIENSTCEITKQRVMHAARLIFRSKLMESVDEFIVFQPLSPHQISIMVELQLKSVQERIADRKMKLHVTDAAMKLIDSLGCDPTSGVRSIKRLIQEVEDELSEGILRGDFKDEDTILVDTEVHKLVIRKSVSC